ncbi:MAG: KpsF/GutQ family sugar-phosphate isomerase [Nitrospira sp.]|nr:KpsF/GutQ family sugar-phosphate isomerase [bacterium]MBL7049596.1 KpsF/GutQ family sugar-phosphate isomerase [Nitrospira sp.]
MSIIEQAKTILKIEAEAISALINRIDESFVCAVDLLAGCTGKVVVTGMGKSGLIGKKISATMASTGTPAFFLNPAEGSHGDVGMVTKGDVVLALSNSGETDEIVRLLPALKRLEIKLISMTGNPASSLAKASYVSLDVSVAVEACPMGLAPTASTTAALAMGDALAITLLNKRGFTEEDFALFHPAGALGRRLILRVEDLMCTGGNVPVVDEDILMKEAILEISSRRMGLTTVSDKEGKLIGVVTDGDLRRGLEKWGKDFFSLKASDVMTCRPKTISGTVLAVSALAMMEKYSITVIVITDDNDKIEGVIHLHDLLKAGIV